MKNKIKVLIVDDSQLIRKILADILGRDGALEVVGVAVDPLDAREKIKELSPDVITLDIEMPKMDGITFLRNLMRLRPMPVVMISTLTAKGAAITLEALELGAVDYIPKPKMAVKDALPALAAEIIAKVKYAARANVSAIEHIANKNQFIPSGKDVPKGKADHIDIIAIGASTGGTEAIKEVLRMLPVTLPPIVIVQHMPPGFTRSFADRLDCLFDLKVEEFTGSGKKLESGHVYLANGSEHLRVKRKGVAAYAFCDDSLAVNRHKPSVDVLFDSVAEYFGGRCVGIILTGMGADGATGLGNIRSEGGITIAQNEASSVVWGMPRAAVEQGSATDVIALNKIGRYVIDCCYGQS